MENEVRRLRALLDRYRFLLRNNTDPQTDAALRGLAAEAEARLNEIEQAQARSPRSGPIPIGEMNGAEAGARQARRAPPIPLRRG